MRNSLRIHQNFPAPHQPFGAWATDAEVHHLSVALANADSACGSQNWLARDAQVNQRNQRIGGACAMVA